MVAMWWLANDERKKEQAQAMRRASQVATLRSWSFHYDSKAKEYSIFFGLLNVDDEPVAADVYVDIRIVNNRNEEVYKATKLIFKDNYAYYETPFSGTEYLAVTPWGDFYPCHQFVGQEEFLMGNVDEGITKPEIAEEFRGCSVYSKESCRTCFARFYCSGGCMANSYKFHNTIHDTYEVSCEMERKRVECAIMIKAALADEEQ